MEAFQLLDCVVVIIHLCREGGREEREGEEEGGSRAERSS